MLRTPTVFVIGAGASAEFGLPVGYQLAELISEKLNVRFSDGVHPDSTGDHGLLSIFRGSGGYLQKFWQIRDGIVLANSIDNYIDNHRHDDTLTRIGKACIYKAIRESENSSALARSIRSTGAGLDFSAISDTWMVKLFRILQEGVARGNVESILQDARFVVFNYDRCLEHFLVHSLMLLYALDEPAAAAIVNRADIVHVYGRTGRLPWQTSIHDDELVEPFGQEVNLDGVRGSNETIKTYTEQVRSDVAVRISEYMDFAERIVFLGLSYADQNLSLLNRKNEPGLRISILGTAKSFSSWDVETVSARLKDIYGADKIQINVDATCAQLFDRFRQTLIH